MDRGPSRSPGIIYTGDTVVNDGELRFFGNERIADTGKVIVNGGKFMTGSTETIDELQLISGEVAGGKLTASTCDLRTGTVTQG